MCVKDIYKIYFDNISRHIMNNLNSQNFNRYRNDSEVVEKFISAITELINDNINYLNQSKPNEPIKPFKEYLENFVLNYNNIITRFFNNNNNLLLLTENFFSQTSILSINSSSNDEHTYLQSPSHNSQRTHTTTLRRPLESVPPHYIDRSQSPFDSQVNRLKEPYSGRLQSPFDSKW